MASHITRSPRPRSPREPAAGAVQSVTRAMTLLDLVARAGDAGVTEIARQAGLHVATAHNLLRTLAAGGYLVNVAGRYRIGPAVQRLALHWSPASALPAMVAPDMIAMSAACGESGSLGLLVGHGCEVIPVSHGTDEVIAQPRQRTFHRPLAVATGRVLAAFAPDDLRQPIIADHVAERRDLTAPHWLAELDRVRREACVVIHRPHPGGVDAVAVPLFGSDDRPLAALGAHCPNFRSTPAHLARMIAALEAAAVAVSRRLGGRQSPTPSSRIAAAVRRQLKSSPANRAHSSGD